jgi:hypothetical protein
MRRPIGGSLSATDVPPARNEGSADARLPPARIRWRVRGHRLHAWLVQPVHPSTLGVSKRQQHIAPA